MSPTATLPLAPEPPGPVVTVMIGPDTVLSLDGMRILQQQLPPAEHHALITGLFDTLRHLIAAGPKLSATTEAAAALDGLTALLNPSDAQAADAALAAPILARCHALIEAGKAHLKL